MFDDNNDSGLLGEEGWMFHVVSDVDYIIKKHGAEYFVDLLTEKSYLALYKEFKEMEDF
jgi:hypothetical protein